MALTNVPILDAASATVQIQVDSGSGTNFQVYKTAFGSAGAVTLVDSGNPLPVTGPITDTQIRATPVGVSLSGTTTVAGNMFIDNLVSSPVMGASALASDRLHETAGNLTPKFAKIDTSASGDTTLVAAVTSKKIRVLGYRVQGGGAVSFSFKNVGGASLTGPMPTGAAGGGGGAAFSPVGHFETTAGVGLALTLSSAVAVGGHVCYVEAT